MGFNSAFEELNQVSFIHTAMLQQAGVFAKDQAVSLHMPL